MLIAIQNATRGTQLATRTIVADGFWSRLRGLLGRSLNPGDGMLLVPCRSVHTFGMRYSLDVAFLDDRHRVVAVAPGLLPNRTTSHFREAQAALELPAETLARTHTTVGDELLFLPANSDAHGSELTNNLT